MDVFTSLLEKAISWEDNDIIIPAAIYSVVSKNGSYLAYIMTCRTYV